MKTYILFFLFCSIFFAVRSEDDKWKLVFSDEFDASLLDLDKWNYEIGGTGWGNQELQYYTNREKNIRIEDGCLVIEAHKEQYQPEGASRVWNYTSGRITTRGKGFITYGKVEARIALPHGKGTWPAFWMMPEKNTYGGWPRSGEIDIMEHVGKDPTMVSHAVHTYEKSGGKSWSYRRNYPDLEDNFHTYSIEWDSNAWGTDDAISFYVDDVKHVTLWQSGVDWRAWPFDHAFFAILNLAVGGTWGGDVDDAIFDTPVKMKVDYVNLYQLVTDTGISSEENNADKLRVVSFGDYLHLQTDTSLCVQLFDIMGHSHGIWTVSGDTNIDTVHLSQGIYFLKTPFQTYKIIK